MMNWLYSQEDNLNHNFCRIADPSDPRPWCYTTNPNVRFDFCDCSGPSRPGPTPGPMPGPMPGPVCPGPMCPRQMSRPTCQRDAGTITKQVTFEYSKYDSKASILSSPRNNGNGNINRIFGGKDATPGEVPWQVNLFIDGTQLNNLMCGGTLVSSTVSFIPSKIL